MGNFHCIESTCARVVWREYLPPVVRWRYGGEDWQELEADDYNIEDLPGQCCADYDVTVNYEIVGCNGEVEFGGTPTVRIPNAIYKGIDYKLVAGFVRSQIVVDYFDCVQNRNKQKAVWSSSGKSDLNHPCTVSGAIFSRSLSSWGLVDLVRVDSQPDECKTCTFTVYKNGQIIHQEERPECPEVEQLPCRLSDESKEIKIEKLAYLERIDVTDYAYQNFAGSVYQAKIPDHCLNIYRNDTVTIIPQFEGFPTPTNSSQATYHFIEQICSANDCPPPEYEVFCDCDCEDCPPGTCAVECNGRICCHDQQTGKAVLEIAIADFCQCE